MNNILYVDFAVKQMTLTQKSFPTLVEGSKQFIYARFTFSGEWSGVPSFLLITRDNKTYTQEISDNKALISDDVTETAGTISLAVIGKQDDTVLTTTGLTIKLIDTDVPPETEERLTTDYLANTLVKVQETAGQIATDKVEIAELKEATVGASESAARSASNASDSETSAKEAMTKALKAQTAAETAQSASEKAQIASESAKDTAVTKAQEASDSEANAAESEKNSKVSETNSHNSELKAKEYMDSTEKSAEETAKSAEQCAEDVAIMDDFIESLTKLSKAPPFTNLDDALVLATPTLNML